MQIKAVAVIGAGGNVGSAIIGELQKDRHFAITAVSRQTSKYTGPDGINTIKVDFDDQSSLNKAFTGQDAVVCCVPGGATDFDHQKLLIDSAIAAGVKLFFASEFVSDIMSPHYAIFPPSVVGDKIKTRKYLEEKSNEGKITYTALNGGPFFDMWTMRGPAGFDIPARKAMIYGTGNNAACWTPLPVIAIAAANMLRRPEEIVNRAIFVCGVKDVTQNGLLEALELETGAKFEVEHVDVKKLKAEALQRLAEGNTRGAMRGLTINSNFNEEDSKANFWDKVENELVGVKAVGAREALRAAMIAYGMH